LGVGEGERGREGPFLCRESVFTAGRKLLPPSPAPGDRESLRGLGAHVCPLVMLTQGANLQGAGAAASQGTGAATWFPTPSPSLPSAFLLCSQTFWKNKQMPLVSVRAWGVPWSLEAWPCLSQDQMPNAGSSPPHRRFLRWLPGLFPALVRDLRVSRYPPAAPGASLHAHNLCGCLGRESVAGVFPNTVLCRNLSLRLGHQSRFRPFRATG
jgi:hypothetical protein